MNRESTPNSVRPTLRQPTLHGPRGQLRPVKFPSAQLSPRNFAITLPTRTTPTLMSHSQSAAASSSNPQLVLNNALKAYEKSTKQDLLTHPLASQLQACNSPVAVLTILQQQVHGLDQSRISEDRRTKWLVPTVKVLCTFSTTLEERAGLVSLRTLTCLRFALSYLYGRYFHPRKQHLLELVSFS